MITLPMLLLLLAVGASAEPLPGRIPKVYNALITSNQNLEPSKAYPVYQPVLHDAAFGFPFQPFYYSDFPLSNGLIPELPSNAGPPQPAENPPATDEKEQNNSETADEEKPSNDKIDQPTDSRQESEKPAKTPEPLPLDQLSRRNEQPKGVPQPPNFNDPRINRLQPPSTDSPIPLNQFGLPPQVQPLGQFNPAYNGFTQIGPYPYSYPGVRFYNPYEPFSYNTYWGVPSLYNPSFQRPFSPPIPPQIESRNPVPDKPESSERPPSEPDSLNILNNAPKDPSIPNVPPPPLPQGGLKSDDNSQ